MPAPEVHPFGNFIPTGIKFLLLGSFTAIRTEKEISEGYDWFYCSKRNLFWPIIKDVYKVDLPSRKEKEKLFEILHIGIMDIISTTERKSKSSLDNNLINIVLNPELPKILGANKIKKIFFSSRFVEKLYKKHFKSLISEHPEIELITLPSPSPRYAAMSKIQKTERYKEIFPRLSEKWDSNNKK